MELTLEQSRKLRATGVLLLMGILLGTLYFVMAHGFYDLSQWVMAIIIGILIALTVAWFEFIIFVGQIRKLHFYKLLIIRILSYLFTTFCIISLITIFYRMFKYDISFWEVLHSEEFQQYIQTQDLTIATIYALALIITVNFTIQMDRKMGNGMLWGFITGKYYQPRNIDIAIMFIKIQQGKNIIESFGRLHYHRYINDLIFEMTDVILNRKGIIYEYVDEDIVIVWNLATGIEDANCLRTYFEIKDQITAKKLFFYEKYQIIPEFTAALHCGSVIRGEIGQLKSAIKYHGDAMNTSSRILELTASSHDILASAEIVEQLELPIIYQTQSYGTVDLKGKARKVNLFAIYEKELN